MFDNFISTLQDDDGVEDEGEQVEIYYSEGRDGEEKRVKCPIYDELSHLSRKFKSEEKTVGIDLKVDTREVKIKLLFYQEYRMNTLQLAFNYSFTQH